MGACAGEACEGVGVVVHGTDVAEAFGGVGGEDDFAFVVEWEERVTLV